MAGRRNLDIYSLTASRISWWTTIESTVTYLPFYYYKRLLLFTTFYYYATSTWHTVAVIGCCEIRHFK